MEFLRQARQQTSVTVANAHSDAPVNQLGSARPLATAADQVIVQPNNDTLYTMGHLDLAGGALVLHVPAVAGHRYYSFEFLDPYTNVFRYVGTRTTGDGAGNFVITGPGFHGRIPRGLRRIRSAYRRVWLVGRTLVSGAADLPAVHRVQDGYRLIPLAALRARAWPGVRRGRRAWSLATARPSSPAAWPSSTRWAPRWPRTPRRPRRADPARAAPDRGRAGPAPLARAPQRDRVGGAAARPATPAISTCSRSARRSPRSRCSRTTAGSCPPFINGAFGTDYAYRAVVALFGSPPTGPQEALYIIGVTDPSHQYLDGVPRLRDPLRPRPTAPGAVLLVADDV